MSELDGFEVMPYINQRTNKGKIAARDKRIEQLEGEIGGTRTISIPSLAFNYVDNRLESIGSGGELYARKRGTHVAHYGTRWHELFGTPERAARTLRDYCFNTASCAECGIGCKSKCFEDYDALLEWLRGESND